MQLSRPMTTWSTIRLSVRTAAILPRRVVARWHCGRIDVVAPVRATTPDGLIDLLVAMIEERPGRIRVVIDGADAAQPHELAADVVDATPRAADAAGFFLATAMGSSKATNS